MDITTKTLYHIDGIDFKNYDNVERYKNIQTAKKIVSVQQKYIKQLQDTCPCSELSTGYIEDTISTSEILSEDEDGTWYKHVQVKTYRCLCCDKAVSILPDGSRRICLVED